MTTGEPGHDVREGIRLVTRRYRVLEVEHDQVGP